ncbi:MAG TPA: FkbM family methyltransferase [Prosthecobacter sp.]
MVRGPLKGAQFVVTPGMGATYAWGWDAMNQKFLARHLRPGSVIYDIGANRGQMALYFSRLTGPTGKVVSFEPVPQNFELLERNLQLNAASNVQAVRLALAADDQPRRFGYDAAHHTMGTFVGNAAKLQQWQQTFEVTCDTLDHFASLGFPVPDVLKIDVEGAGGEVLCGAENLLRTRRPAIYFEMHAAGTSSPEWDALQRLEKDFGYTVQDINHTFHQPRGTEWNAAAWCEPPR